MTCKKIKDYKDFGKSNEDLFGRLRIIISEIVTGIEDHEIISIRKDEVIAIGYSDRESFEEEYLPKVFKEVSGRTNVGVELIEDLLKGRIKYLPQSDSTGNNQRGNNP